MLLHLHKVDTLDLVEYLKPDGVVVDQGLDPALQFFILGLAVLQFGLQFGQHIHESVLGLLLLVLVLLLPAPQLLDLLVQELAIGLGFPRLIAVLLALV